MINSTIASVTTSININKARMSTQVCEMNPIFYPSYPTPQPMNYYVINPTINEYPQVLHSPPQYPYQVLSSDQSYMPPPHSPQPPSPQHVYVQSRFQPPCSLIQQQPSSNVKRSQYLSLLATDTSSCSPMKTTRLEPISTNAHQIYATYFPHRIFVGSLTRMTRPGDLANFFQKFGQVIEAKVVYDSNGNSKGFGFVSFSSAEPVKTILNLGSIYMNNKRIAVASAIRKNDPSNN